MRFLWPTTICLLASAVGPPAMAAQPVCGPRDEIMTELSQKFSEATTAVGVTSSGELLEVLTSADRSTWSIVLSRPGGVSCIVAVGEEWQERRTLARQERMM